MKIKINKPIKTNNSANFINYLMGTNVTLPPPGLAFIISGTTMNFPSEVTSISAGLIKPPLTN
jgi:hypothetical protein